MNRSNSIYYRFKSEKKKYSINFDTTEISIGDVKKEIIKRRNMDKVPEKFELLFFDEGNNEIRDENQKIEPLKLLLIKRIPWYKLSSTFTEVIRDPNEINSLRFSDMVVAVKRVNTVVVNNLDPLEKVYIKLNNEILTKRFGCKLCSSIENIPMLVICCGETVCDKCIVTMQTCKFCNETSPESMPNKREKDLRDRLFSILEKKAIQALEESQNAAAAALAEASVVENNQKYVQASILVNNNNVNTNPLYPMNPTNTITTNNISTTGTAQVEEINSGMTYNNPFLENAKFFIIKSSNKDNVESSQKYSEWATTVANQRKLNDAFQSQNVILIFSVNKSGSFQGYAVMTSFISDKVSKYWQNDFSVRLGGSFSVQWLCMCELPFMKVKNLSNPMNNNEPVIKSRDTQELPKDIGIALCNYCNEQEKFENNCKGIKAQFLTEELIAKVSEDIKKSRESFYQRQNMMRAPIGGAIQPMAREMNSFPFYPSYFNPAQFYDVSQFPKGPFGYFPPQGYHGQMQEESEKDKTKSRDRSRDRSLDRSVSSKKSKKSK